MKRICLSYFKGWRGFKCDCFNINEEGCCKSENGCSRLNSIDFKQEQIPESVYKILLNKAVTSKQIEYFMQLHPNLQWDKEYSKRKGLNVANMVIAKSGKCGDEGYQDFNAVQAYDVLGTDYFLRMHNSKITEFFCPGDEISIYYEDKPANWRNGNTLENPIESELSIDSGLAKKLLCVEHNGVKYRLHRAKKDSRIIGG